MELNVLEKETCIGKFCSEGVIESVCCAFEKFAQIKYSPGNTITEFCLKDNLRILIFFTVIIIFLLTIFVVLIITFIIFMILVILIMCLKKRKETNFSIYVNNDVETYYE
jgi:hypothetical protein